MRRALTKTRVDRCDWMSSRSAGWIDGQMLLRTGPAAAGPLWGPSTKVPRSPMSSMGTTISISIGLRTPASMMVTGRQSLFFRPPRNRAVSSSGRWVADRPIRWGGVSLIASSRSRVRDMWAPRLVPASAWISSMITASTRVRPALA